VNPAWGGIKILAIVERLQNRTDTEEYGIAEGTVTGNTSKCTSSTSAEGKTDRSKHERKQWMEKKRGDLLTKGKEKKKPREVERLVVVQNGS